MSTERSLESIQQEADAAVFNARRFFDPETGSVNYDAFTPEQLAALDAGPGRVARLAEQKPIHLQPDLMSSPWDEVDGVPVNFDGSPFVEEVLIPSHELFLRDYNNFRTRFFDDRVDPIRAQVNAADHSVQRFRILFPELNAAATEYVVRRELVEMPNRLNRMGPLAVDEHYGPFMQFVYGVMAQLVDLDDPSHNPGATVEQYGTRAHLTI